MKSTQLERRAPKPKTPLTAAGCLPPEREVDSALFVDEPRWSPARFDIPELAAAEARAPMLRRVLAPLEPSGTKQERARS